MVFEMRHNTSLLLNQKIRKYVHINNIFIVSLFLCISDIFFKLILEPGNISNKRPI